MKKLSLILLIIISFLLSINKAIADPPYMEAVINWQYLSQDSFLIKVIYYTDCNLPNPATTITLNIKCDATGSALSSVSLPLTSIIDVTPVCNSTNSRCGSSSSAFPYGIKKCTYQSIVKINNAGNCCLLRLSFDSYERTGDITTGGAYQPAYIEAKLNRCQSTGDNSPEILLNPPIIVASGENYVYNFNAIDADGDSLTYELTPPLQAHNTPVTYSNPYSYDKPLYFWDFPYNYSPFPRGFHLETITGDLMFRPMGTQYITMAVKIREYRNSTEIGEIMIEWPVIVTSYTNKAPSINTNVYLKEVCAGSPVSFDLATTDIDTSDVVTINWNNAIPNANWSVDSTNQKRPKATLTWTPSDSDVRNNPYTFIVFVEDNNCPLKGYYSKAFQIKVKPSIAANHTVIDSGCGKYQFSAQKIKGNIQTYNWYIKNFFNNYSTNFTYRFSKPGRYPYKLTINNPNSCPVSYYDTLVTDTFLYIELPADTHICSDNKLLIQPKTYYGSMPLHYIWNNSNNDTLDHLSITVTKDTVINLKVIDALGCETTDQMKIFVYPLPVAEAGNDTAICRDDMITLTASGGDSYEWSIGDTTASIQIIPKSSAYYTVKVSTNYHCFKMDSVYVRLISFSSDAGKDTTICRGESLKLKATGGIIYKWNNGQTTNEITVKPDASAYFSVVVTDINHCTSEDSVLVKINQLPIANAGKDTTICRGESLKLKATGGIIFKWSNGQTTNEITVKPDASAYFSVVVTDTNHCTSEDSVLVKINQLQIANAGKDTTICRGESLKLKATGGIIYKWNNGQTTNEITVKPDASAYFSVVVTDTNHCTAEDSVLVNIKPVPIANAGTDREICRGQTIDLQTAGGQSYLWNTGDTTSFITVTPTLSQQYVVKVIGSNNCQNMDTVFIKVDPLPVIDFSASPLNGNIPLTVQFDNLTTISEGSLYRFYWDFGDGDTSIQFEPAHTFISIGTYRIKLSAVSAKGCIDSMVKQNYISAITSIENNAERNGVKIVPNPAGDQFVVLSEISLISFIKIYNNSGLVLMNLQNINSRKKIINSTVLENGLYLVEVTMENERSYLLKVMIQK